MLNLSSIIYTGCDIFLLGSPEAAYRCACRVECENFEITPEMQQEYEECLDRCAEDYGDDPLYEDICFDGCEAQLYAQEIICKDSCGSKPYPVRNIIGYGYVLIAAYERIPFDPRDNMKNWILSMPSGFIQSDKIIIPDWSPPPPWPDVYDGNNRCFGIAILIYFEGLYQPCYHEVWNCEIFG